MSLLRLFSCSLLLFTASNLTIAGGTWPQWMGPNRDSISEETGLLQSWPEGGPKLVWKGAGLGTGFSTVSIAAGRIYTMGDIDGKSTVVALNEKDGKVVWTTKVGRAGAPGWGNFAGPRATPTVDGDLLFVICQYGEIACLNVKSGSVLWRKHFVNDFGGKLPEWGFSESPLVAGEKLLCTPGGSRGTIVALNKKTGETIWQSSSFTDNAAYASLVPATIGGVQQVVQLTAQSVAGVAIKNGKLLWRKSRRGKTAVIPTPIVKDNYVYVSSGYGIGCNLLEISKQGDSFQAKEIYSNKNMINHHGGVLLDKDHVWGYCDRNGWVCQNFKTGDIVWREKRKQGKGSLVFADGCFYLRAEGRSGTVVLIEASTEGFKEKGRFDQPDRSRPRSWPHPVVADGRLYIRDQDILLCYDVKK